LQFFPVLSVDFEAKSKVALGILYENPKYYFGYSMKNNK